MSGSVLDLAYGRVRVGDRQLDVGAVLEDIDDPRRRAPARPALAEALRAAGPTAVVAPTVWGPVRTGSLRAELAAAAPHAAAAVPIPRAVAIAASHADATVHRCAVVETRMLPSTGGHWSVHAVARRQGRWELGNGEVTLPRRIPADPGWARLLEEADAVFVDGPDPASIERARRLLAEVFGVRAESVDRRLLGRHGAGIAAVTGADLLAGLPAAPVAGRRPSAWAPALVAALLSVAVVVVGVWSHWPRPAVVDRETVQVGRARLEVPGGWRRTDMASTGADGAGRRAVFAAPDDGRRVIVVVSTLRSGSSSATVAASLRQRIAQRGDDAVAEFAPDLAYAGRQVIGYRETPASGEPVAWYISVDQRTQVSVGCQGGTGAESVEAACRGAVGSVRVGPE
ncbi:type VII secretion-associated protein [Gordonia sp. (in: high G+C Gram-positive bacteria)]|uniref:type VII secretion-associated protein n=2 Tax=Gordonia sp. (in: high G+C Gram-positive bacteria) TaxID=84139 RepID=UPI003C71B8BA